MKSLLAVIRCGPIICLALLCHCTTIRSIDRSSSDWNPVGMWKSAPGSTHDFVPSDFDTRSLARTSGEWICDPQDGTRFFVPAAGTKLYHPQVLAGEAVKATNRHTLRGQKTLNTVSVALAPLHIATLGLLRNDIWEQSASSDSDSSSDFSDFTTADSTAEKNKCAKNHDHSRGSHKECHKDDKTSRR